MFKQKINKGIKLLNKVFPGWYKSKNLKIEKLYLRECSRCILGQLYGEFWSGTKQLFNCNYRATKIHGFELDDNKLVENIDYNYNLLTSEWKEEIRKLRKKDANAKTMPRIS